MKGKKRKEKCPHHKKHINRIINEYEIILVYFSFSCHTENVANTGKKEKETFWYLVSLAAVVWPTNRGQSSIVIFHWNKKGKFGGISPFGSKQLQEKAPESKWLGMFIISFLSLSAPSPLQPFFFSLSIIKNVNYSIPVVLNQCAATHWCATRCLQVCLRNFSTNMKILRTSKCTL